MPVPSPFPGLVLNYAYLWRDEHRRGLEEGAKNRPCLIVAIETVAGDGQYVTVVPITHQPPRTPEKAIELPSPTKRRIGLDDQQSWIVLTDLNRFRWPGHDLRQIPGKAPGIFAYGVVPPNLLHRITETLLGQVASDNLRATPR